MPITSQETPKESAEQTKPRTDLVKDSYNINMKQLTALLNLLHIK